MESDAADSSRNSCELNFLPSSKCPSLARHENRLRTFDQAKQSLVRKTCT